MITRTNRTIATIVAVCLGLFACHAPAAQTAPVSRRSAHVFAQASSNGLPEPGVQYPASPHFYVSTAGNDNAAGSALLPLLTLQEALNRLGQSGWTGQPIVTLVNKPALGANPILNVPAPSYLGSPILIQGTFVDSGLGTLTVSSGVQGAIPTTNATLTFPSSTFTSGAQAGRVLNYLTGGSNAGTRTIIHSNTTTVLTLTSRLAAAPTNTDTVSISDLAGGFSYTGTMLINAPGGLSMDGVEVTGDVGLIIAGVGVQLTACRFIASNTSASGPLFIGPMDGAAWMDNSFAGGFTSPWPLAQGVTACGSRYDGTSGGIVLGNSPTTPVFGLSGRMFMVNMSMTGAVGVTGLCAGGGYDTIDYATGGFCQFTNAAVSILNSRMGLAGINFGGVPTPFAISESGAAIDIAGVTGYVGRLNITGVAGGNNVVGLTNSHVFSLTHITGTNGSAGHAFEIDHSSVKILDASTTTTLSGASASTDVVVGTNSATTLGTGGILDTAAKRIDANTATYFGP